MLSRKHRFHGLRSLDSVYRHGKTVRGPLLMMRYVRNPKHDNYRAAVVVSKKVHKSAVVRNRIRRRVFEVVRNNDSQIPAGYDLVFTVFEETVATVPAPKLEDMIVKQLKSLPAAT